MNDLAQQGLSYLGDLVNGFFVTVLSFFLQFFPDGDDGIVNAIRSWGDSLAGFDLSFNVFYFIDINLVVGFLSAAVLMLFAFVVYVFVKYTISLIHKLVEMIPVIE